MTIINYDKLFIDGQWRKPACSERIEVFSASTEEPLGSVPTGIYEDMDTAVGAARRAFDAADGWASWEPSRRADAMDTLATALESRSAEMAHRVSAQNGMPITLASQLEAGLPGVLLRYYADLARTALGEEIRPGLFGGTTRVRRVPVGVVGAIVPWNVPQTLTFTKVAPAMAAGCTVVVKPSPETVLDAFLVAEAVAEAGIPSGVINIVPAGREVGAYLVAHPGVDKISFTGSTSAGRTIAETCGRLLRPVSLELGGKSAAIVLEDADLTNSMPDFFAASLLNNGQACYAATRILLPRSRYDEMAEQITEFVAALSVGDALDPGTQIGPLAGPRQRDRVEGYIAKGLSDGARLTTGGARPTHLDRGYFIQPTVFTNVDNNSTIAQEEIFGPVLCMIPYQDDADSIRLANASDYGLGGSVWTPDIARGIGIAQQVRSGTLGINGYLPDVTAPFGGRKNSGLGREFGPEGLSGYLQYQSIYNSGDDYPPH
jgi:acyl-CoA reductase-like NAD-dependent aldehyde dehydrogenase